MARHQVVRNIGMYFAAYRLSQMGWNVLPTARNARGIDLLAHDAHAGRYLGIQVKALSRPKPPAPLGTSIEKLMGDWWIIVTDARTPNPECFIMKPQEVSRLAHRGEKDGGFILAAARQVPHGYFSRLPGQDRARGCLNRSRNVFVRSPGLLL
jgi:hypothetical protein